MATDNLQLLPEPAQAPEQDLVGENYVRDELAMFKRAKGHYDEAFKRMRQNMEFVSGLQWEEQAKMRDGQGRYICNLVLRAIKNKESQLYARNPQVEAAVRKRMNFEVWDGSVEMLQEAMQSIQASQQGAPPNMEAFAVMSDMMRGRQEEALVAKVCEALEKVYNYQVDCATPEFKAQVKKLVTRILTCGVGYILPSLVVPQSPPTPSTTEVKHGIQDRAKHAHAILNRLEVGEIEQDSAEVETMVNIIQSLKVSQQTNDYALDERIEFDFPSATSLFPDEHCRDLQGFVAARRVYQELPMSVDEVNRMFELEGEDQVKSGGSLEEKDPESEWQELGVDPQVKTRVPHCTLVRVFNIETKCDYYLVVGHEKFIQPPTPLEPCVRGFWPIVTIMFNNIEVDPETKASIYPPSDVDLMRDAQKEWNRTREAERDQRNGSAPCLVARKNVLTPDDKKSLRNREPNEIIELENVPADKEPTQVVQPLQVATFNPTLYETNSLEQDLQLTGGMQQANIGPAQPDVTATVGTIAEQSRITSISSNADELDMGLTNLACMVGQMIFQGFSEATIKRIAGRGAPWPTRNMPEYLNMIELKIKAASSGRPNQALQVQKAQTIMPLIINAGGNPIACVEYLVKVLDDQLDVSKFFPIPGQAMMQGPASEKQPSAAPSPAAPNPGPGPGTSPPESRSPFATGPRPKPPGLTDPNVPQY